MIGVSLGDPAGIGPDIIAQCWREQVTPFCVFGVTAAFPSVPVVRVGSPAEAVAVFAQALPLIECAADLPLPSPGRPTVEGARQALAALDATIDSARRGAISALVTAPVSKAELAGIGFTAPGQTEYLARACGLPDADAVMMLAGPQLKVVPITVHQPLASVSASLSVALIVARARIVAAALTRDFGILTPRLAVCGLNPHAGEQGLMGREEIDIITPAIAQLRAEGYQVSGPHAACSLFTPRARQSYDAALCMYHDQALIPLKTLDFEQGVNVTLGLPIIRTSPDHGVAYDLAGSGQASATPMAAALAMAAACVRHRQKEPA